MAFKQRVKSLLKEGNNVTIIIGGMEYSGKVVEFDNLNPGDAHVILQAEDGTQYVLPISVSMAIVVPPVSEIDEPEDEPEGEPELVVVPQKKQLIKPPKK